MVTIYPLIHEFCQQKNLPQPTQRDFNKIGIAVAFRFKNFYILGLDLPPGTVLTEVGFLVQQEQDRKAVVIYYPELFRADILNTIEHYFHKKTLPKASPKHPPEISKNNIDPQPEKQRKRTPIPGPPKPAFSAKPSNVNQRTI